MTKIFNGRFTAKTDEPFVVFVAASTVPVRASTATNAIIDFIDPSPYKRNRF